MADWFYADDGRQTGPITGTDLKQLAATGVIRAETLVWKAGAPNWVEARTVKGLIPTPAAVTPPVDGGPAQLAYATAGLVQGSVAPAPYAPPPDDSGPFRKIAKQFKVDKTGWVGAVVASPDAIYMHKKTNASRRAYGYGVGGIAGMMIASAVKSAADLRGTRSCDVTELPEAVRRQFDPKLKMKKGDIVILRRNAMNFVKTSWTGVLTPQIGDEKFPISGSLFKNGSTKSFLATNGWTLDYPMEPTEAPTHGRLYGLDESQIKDKPLIVRILMVIGGILLIAAFIALRVYAQMNRHR